ncbi:MAG: shikimate kinase [Dehalococcoidales bacterium]|jgi:shikimate kinase|nr:shikimate kinase [Dehalococcoidales bacterium]MDP7110092.1 shikimate kinase [Dehalococcoidales bacterium]MDP7309630.1 shikimate kinase [Dehalococcoidales bacterium]MDP7409437.1 shikimate kinase [Dehalococcoidales bacterium]MDP7675772.1 shikimate kinase [Dehalococcoidales bacterium]|tara:strand:+ start:426 stop:926 length:501 start_codon:yes stop_codon:yes gene_type:complete
MGTGKSSVGQVLAKKLKRRFIDLDAVIEQKANKTIFEIFQCEGESGFRDLEIQVTREIAVQKRTVIACGGGVVLNKINIDRLRENALIVYLVASPSIILKRTSRGQGRRPLLKAADRVSRIEELLNFRRSFYEHAADIEIDTSELDINAVVEQIMGRLKKNEGFDF